MSTVPARVYFVAFVFALSTIHVSQEVGMAFAQEAIQNNQPVAISHLDVASNQDTGELTEEAQIEFSEEEFLFQKENAEAMAAVVKKIETRIATLNKWGMETPITLQDQLVATKAAIAYVETAQYSDEGVQNAVYIIRRSGDELRDGMQRFELLSQTPRMLKRAQTEVKNLDERLALLEKRSATYTVNDTAVAQTLQDYRQLHAFISSGALRAERQLASNDAEGAMTTLRTDVWDQLSTAHHLADLLEGLMQDPVPTIDYSVFNGEPTGS